MIIQEFLSEVEEYYANLVYKNGTTPMPYVLTAKELVQVVIKWTTCPPEKIGHFVSALEKAYRNDFSETKKLFPSGKMEIEWN